MRNSGMFLYYSFGYLTLEQEYICLEGGERACLAYEICQNNLAFKVDTSSVNYIENWTQQMGLMCTDRSYINAIVTGYFIAYGLAGLLLYELPDKWGRKKTIMFFGSVHTACQFVIIFVPNYYVRFGTFALMGACQLKNSISYVWLFDLVQQKDKPIAVGVLNAWDCLTISVVSFYFKFVSKYWFSLYLFMSLIGFASLMILTFIIPESPKWLLHNKRREEAIYCFNVIAKINCSAHRIPESAQFTESEAKN